MGMSASQARYLGLIARQSNLEYQGQQINQERTILSQQCTALYNSLLAMEVPTPPSTSDFTSIQYSGQNGATTYTFDASAVKPGSDGGYRITLGTTEYGQSLSKNTGYVTTSAGAETVYGKFVTLQTYGEFGESTIQHVGYELGTQEPTGNEKFMKMVPGSSLNVGDMVYVLQDGQFLATEMTEEMKNGDVYVLSNEGDVYNAELGDKPIGAEITKEIPGEFEPKNISKDAISNFFVYENGEIRVATENDFEAVTGSGTSIEYRLKDGVTYLWENGTTEDSASFSNDTDKLLIAGKTPYTLQEALNKGIINQTDYDGYVNAINNAGISYGSGVYGPDDFYLYVDDNNRIHFALISDVNDNSGAAVTYDYIANGAYTKNTEYDYTQLEFDVSTGRITSITIPTTYDAEGKPLTYTTIDVSAETVTDEAAYQDAYAQYEYEQYLYDKKQQEINAKTEIIQQEDRNLELKLQRLDNERTQITTEIEAVEKVINDNIESSYKTFSG